MRIPYAIALLLLVAACDFASEPKAVNAANLPPLSGREQALLAGAEAQAKQGNVAAAEKDYQSAVSASNGHVEAHVALAKLYIGTHQPEKERAVLERARVLQPNHPEVNYLIGKLDLAAGDNDAALSDFMRGLNFAPGNIDLSNGAGIANDMLGQHRLAQSIYLRAIAEHKGENLAGVRTNLGMSYLFSNEPKKAVAVLKDEAKKPNASTVTRTNLALAYDLLGKPMDAKFALRGEGDDDTQKATLARLKQYIADTTPGKKPTEVNPVIAPQVKTN